MKFSKILSIIFIISLIGCAPATPAPTATPVPTATHLPSPTPTPSPTPVPQINSNVKSNTFLFPCSEEYGFAPIPIKKGISVVLRGKFKEMGIVSEYEGQATNCAMLPLQDLDIEEATLPELAVSEFSSANYGSALEEITPENAQYIGEVFSFGTGTIQRITYTPDGQYFVVVTPNGVHFYDGTSFEFIRVIQTPSTFFDFSPDSNFLYTASNLPEKQKTVQVWNILDGSFETSIQIDDPVIRSFSVSPDGKRFLTTGSAGAVLWGVAHGEPVKTIDKNPETSYAIFSHSGDSIAIGLPGKVKMTGIGGQQKWQKNIEHNVPNYDGDVIPIEINFSPDDETIVVVGETVNGKTPINKYQVISGEESNAWTKPYYSSSKRYFADNGGSGIYIAVRDQKNSSSFMIKGIEYENDNPRSDNPPRETPVSGQLIDITFSPDEKHFVFASSNGAIQVWDLETQTVEYLLKDFSTPVCDLDITHDGSIVMYVEAIQKQGEICGGRYVLFWDIWDNATILLPDEKYGQVHDVQYFQNDNLFVLSGTPTQWSWEKIITQIWSTETNDLLETYVRTGLVGSDIDVNEEGSVLATTESTWLFGGSPSINIYVWEVGRTQRPIIQLSGQSYSLNREIAISPEGNVLAFEDYKGTYPNSNYVIKLWDIQNNQEISPLSFPFGYGSFSFIPDSNVLVTLTAKWGDNIYNAQFWNTDDWAKVRGQNIKPNLKEDSKIVISQNGLLMALITENDEIAVYRIDDKVDLLTTLTGHAKGVNEIAFSRDGRFLVSGSDDGTIKMWAVMP